MKAKDVMISEVLTVTSNTSVEELARLMLEHRISDVPVADEQGVVTVLEGQVDVWGSTNSETQREAARLAVEGIVPPERINFNLNLLPPRLRAYMGGL